MVTALLQLSASMISRAYAFFLVSTDEQCLDGSEIKAGKPDENSEDHNESAERDTKEDEDSQDEEEQDSGCSSDPESCSTDDSDEADKEEVRGSIVIFKV